ncbi:MAG: hypothetical protein PUC59_07770 [Firmicutes bacterium]|nr:hypothetical protein [Bacillota bacterium]
MSLRRILPVSLPDFSANAPTVTALFLSAAAVDLSRRKGISGRLIRMLRKKDTVQWGERCLCKERSIEQTGFAYVKIEQMF